MTGDTPRVRLPGLFRQHPGLLLTVLYVAASLVGMLYSFAFLREFGVNYFYFAQAGDFLLASLREPLTWLVVAAALLLLLGDNAMSRWWQRKPHSAWTRWYGSPRYRAVNYLLAIGLIVLYILFFAQLEARSLREEGGRTVRLQLADGSPVLSRTLLGTTSQFVIVFDRETQAVRVHPHENVLWLEIPAR